MEFRPTIGLEIHAELATKTKMFCACKNDPDETRPNVNVCPVCLAHPGTLPVINKEAVRQVLRVGTAVDGALADFSEFDRKSYFYPDIPKGYQISQYAHPLVSGGKLLDIAITRVHLEEDTARSTHAENKPALPAGRSLVDFNRAGIPLMELVTEPVIHDAETAGAFARELQLLLRTLGAGEANLEKGEMRIEANISVSKDAGKFGTKVEVKNLNSFRSVERAIAYEIARQIKCIERGEKLTQETRGWNEASQETFSQRIKEGSADYRYFPEPDLPKLMLTDVPEFSRDVLKTSLEELPSERRARYRDSYTLKDEDIAFLIAPERSSFFDAVAEALSHDVKRVTLAANYFISDMAGDVGACTPGALAKLIDMVVARELSSRGAKDVLAVLKASGGAPDVIAKEKGLLQVEDLGVLKEAVLGVIAANPGVVQDFRAGKGAALQYLVGQAMKATKGAGNPILLREMFEKELAA